MSLAVAARPVCAQPIAGAVSFAMLSKDTFQTPHAMAALRCPVKTDRQCYAVRRTLCQRNLWC